MKKKICFLLIFILILIINICCLSSCKSFSFSDIKEITVEEIFQLENDGYIYFYRDSCPNCEKIKSTVIKYGKYSLDNDILFFRCDIEKDENNIVRRGHENGEGINEKFWVTGVKSIDELCIAGTPSIIYFNNEEKQTELCGSGKTEVKNYLNELMNKKEEENA